MNRRRGARAAASADRFLARLREALSRFSDGVHAVTEPATAASIAEARTRLGAELAPSLLEVYAFSDGIWLFDDEVRILPLAELAKVSRRGEPWLVCGRVEGGQLLVAPDGRVYEEDEDGDISLSAPTLEDELLTRVARESLLIDAEGEWKEVFGPDGDLLPAVRRRRGEAARRRVPEAARWLIEEAELALELEGDEAAAERCLGLAVELDPGAAAPRELLGLLLVARGALEEGARALAAAAEHSPSGRRVDRAATAAEAAARAGLDEERTRMAALALAAEPGLVARLAAEAETAMEEGRLEDADRRAALARAVAGDGAELPLRLRVRSLLRPLS